MYEYGRKKGLLPRAKPKTFYSTGPTTEFNWQNIHIPYLNNVRKHEYDEPKSDFAVQCQSPRILQIPKGKFQILRLNSIRNV